MNYWFCLDILFYASPVFYSKNVTVSLIDMFQSSLNISRRLLWSTQGVRKPLDLYTSWMFEKLIFSTFLFLFPAVSVETCAPPLDTFWPWPLLGGVGWTSFLWRPTKVLRNNSSFLGCQCCQEISGYTKQSCLWCFHLHKLEMKTETTTLNHLHSLSSLLSLLSLYELMTRVWGDWRLCNVYMVVQLPQPSYSMLLVVEVDLNKLSWYNVDILSPILGYCEEIPKMCKHSGLWHF